MKDLREWTGLPGERAARAGVALPERRQFSCCTIEIALEDDGEHDAGPDRGRVRPGGGVGNIRAAIGQ